MKAAPALSAARIFTIGHQCIERPRPRQFLALGERALFAGTLLCVRVLDSLEFGNRIITSTVSIPSPLLKTSIKLHQASLARLEEMRPVGIGNCGWSLDHCSDSDGSLHLSECVRCTG
jgi:hypothetical protein